MKSAVRILMVAAAAVVTALATYALSRGLLCHGGAAGRATPELPGLRDSAWLVRRLQLTPEQAVKVRALDGDYRRRLEALCTEHCAARQQLRERLFSKTDSEPTRTLLEQMARAQVQSDLATLEHIRDVYRELTPAQQKRFADLVTPGVCGECPTGLHACGAEPPAACRPGEGERK